MVQSETITPRFLPHWYVPGAAHFVTYRLYGTFPDEVLDNLREMREALLRKKPPVGQSVGQHRSHLHKQLFAAYDQALDRGGHINHLADPRVAAIVRSNLYHHHGSKYHLLAYCVMSNHVHVLFIPLDETSEVQASRLHHGEEQASPLHHGEQTADVTQSPVGEEPDATSPLSKIMHSLKSYTAHEANKILGRTGAFWQSESYDHWVRDDEELERIVNYIGANPVRAGLVKQPHDWYFCSCHDRFLTDGEILPWLRWDR